MAGISVEEFTTPDTPDYPRANGAPMVMVKGKRVRMSRPSNYAKPLDDESALTNWRIDTAAFGVASSKELQARYVSTKREDRKAITKLREDAINAGRGGEAAAIGTAIHAMSVRWEDPEDDFNPPDPYLSALRAYSLEMDRLGLKSHLYECALVNLEFKTAGTADRIYELTHPLIAPDGTILDRGTLIIGDLKTGKTLEYSMGEYACQLALYAQGELYDVTNEVFLDTPAINADWGIIAWIPSDQEQGHCEMIWIDLAAGTHAAWLASMVKEHRKLWRNTTPAKVASPASVEDVLADELGAESVDGSAELVVFIKARIATIGKHAEAKVALAKHWPVGVPSPKNGLSDEADIEQVLKLLDDVEAEFGFAWPINDPRGSTSRTQKVS